MQEYSFLPTYKNGEILWGGDFASFVLIVGYINKNNLSISNETYLLHGFDENSGNVYITTNDNVTICSCFGQDPFFVAYIDDKEEEYETYQEALDAIELANKHASFEDLQEV